MASPTRYQRWRIPILNNGAVGYTEPQTPDPDPADPIDYASSDEGGAIQVAVITEIVNPVDDFNLTIGTVTNDARNTHNYTNPELSQDDDDATRALRTGFAAFGSISVGLQSDLGSAQTVSAMTVRYYVNAGASNPTIVEHSPDGTTWTSAPGTWTTGIGDKRTFTLTTPTSRRYWAVRDTQGGGSFAARSMYTWAITGSALIDSDPVWYPAPASNDGDPVTAAFSDSPGECLRVYLATSRLIYRMELDVGMESAGATVFEWYGSDDAGFASTTLLGTLTFTATGSFTLDDEALAWTPAASYQYYQLVHISGGGDEREFYEIRLYSAADIGAITDHPSLTGRSDADQHPADAVTYDNTASGLIATEVQSAIDELDAAITSDVTVPVDHGTVGATETIDISAGIWNQLTLDVNVAITVTGYTVDEAVVAVIKIIQDVSGGNAITWDSDVIFAGDDQPGLTGGDVTWFLLWSDEGDGVIYGAKLGSGSTLTPATTVEDETTFGITPAVGTDTEYARQDHTHGSPPEPTSGGNGPLMLESGHAVPFTFDEILQESDGSDFLYASE